MKKFFGFSVVCFFLIISMHLSIAQVIQDKIYVLNKTCFVPQVESKIGRIQYGPVDGPNPLTQIRRRFRVGLLEATGNSIKYAIYEGKVFTASFQERGGKYIAGPTIAAIDTSGFWPLDSALYRQYFSSVPGKTGHDTHFHTFLDGQPLRRAIFNSGYTFNSHFTRLVHDFSANDDGLFLIIHEKDSLKALRLLSKGKELRHLGLPGIKSIEEEKEMNRSELIAASEVAGDISSITAFSINNELYVLIHDDGRLYRVSGAGLLSVSSSIEEGRTYKDHSLVEDRDTGRAFLLPKEALKELQKSFNDLIMTYGMEIKME